MTCRFFGCADDYRNSTVSVSQGPVVPGGLWL